MKFTSFAYILLVLNHLSVVQAQTTLENVQAFPNLTKFAALLANYITNLNTTDPTIIAPDDNAFAEFLKTPTGAALNTDSDLAYAVVQYHWIPGTLLPYGGPSLSYDLFVTTALTPGTFSNVADGQKLHAVQNGINNSTVFSGLLQNATIYNRTIYDGMEILISNKVFTFPQTISDTAVALNLTASVGAFAKSGLLNTLQGARDVTILVPDNAAFQSIAGSLANLSSSDLLQLMAYHAIEGQVLLTSDLMNATSAQTQNGMNVSVSTFRGAVYFNNARVIVPDVLIRNGVMHVIEDVLNPSNTTATLGAPGFPSATSMGTVPFTSGVATPTSAIPVGALGAQITSAPVSPSTSSDGSGSHTGAIAGGVVGGVVGIAAVVLLFWVLKKRRSTKGPQTDATTSSADTDKGLDRKGTVKSYFKPELEATTKAYQKAELEGNAISTKQPNVLATSTPVPTIPNELDSSTFSHERAGMAEVAAASSSQQEHSALEGENLKFQTQQQQSRAAQEAAAREMKLAQLSNQRRLAQLEYQKRMAELEHEQRMTELDISAATLRSQDTTVSELEAAGNSVQKQ